MPVMWWCLQQRYNIDVLRLGTSTTYMLYHAPCGRRKVVLSVCTDVASGNGSCLIDFLSSPLSSSLWNNRHTCMAHRLEQTVFESARLEDGGVIGRRPQGSRHRGRRVGMRATQGPGSVSHHRHNGHRYGLHRCLKPQQVRFGFAAQAVIVQPSVSFGQSYRCILLLSSSCCRDSSVLIFSAALCITRDLSSCGNERSEGQTPISF